ncbi:MAG TPA: hypothetical protein VKK79_12040 [Candidatus Lokiarchaeia archaeon]|nr:hypothetical protein [Candidatus Lokiarchaeia archaeon]
MPAKKTAKKVAKKTAKNVAKKSIKKTAKASPAKNVAKAGPAKKEIGVKSSNQNEAAGQKGIVRWYDVREGHGLIDPASGGDPIVVLHANIPAGGKGKLQVLYPGDEVDFETEGSDKRVTPLGVNLGSGPIATSVKVTAPAPRRTERYPLA